MTTCICGEDLSEAQVTFKVPGGDYIYMYVLQCPECRIVDFGSIDRDEVNRKIVELENSRSSRKAYVDLVIGEYISGGGVIPAEHEDDLVEYANMIENGLGKSLKVTKTEDGSAYISCEHGLDEVLVVLSKAGVSRLIELLTGE